MRPVGESAAAIGTRLAGNAAAARAESIVFLP
jgi:hypothetical protein